MAPDALQQDAAPENRPASLTQVLRRLDAAPRTAPLIITLFGDAVVPRGGTLWLGSLQPILDCFGLKEGQVRTALSRLTEEGWLARTRRGRLSFHGLGPRGAAEFGAATRRIYAAGPPEWDGTLRMLLLPTGKDTPAPLPEGFGLLAPGMALSPTAEPPAGEAAYWARPRDLAAAREATARAFPLDGLRAGYAAFLRAFAPLDAAATPVEPLEALTLRILLAHAFRRLALRDPALPAVLLPENWPGLEARQLAARLYHRLLPSAEAWLDAHGKGAKGPLPPPGPELARRFR